MFPLAPSRIRLWLLVNANESCAGKITYACWPTDTIICMAPSTQCHSIYNILSNVDQACTLGPFEHIVREISITTYA